MQSYFSPVPQAAAFPLGLQTLSAAPRILLVDDDASFREGLRRVLERAGYQVLTAPDGAVALQIYQQQLVDLVITDLIMPEKEGLETIAELRRRRPDQKVIAISGGGRVLTADFLPLAQRLGVTRTLAKPFTAEVLLSTVAEVLRVVTP